MCQKISRKQSPVNALLSRSYSSDCEIYLCQHASPFPQVGGGFDGWGKTLKPTLAATTCCGDPAVSCACVRVC